MTQKNPLQHILTRAAYLKIENYEQKYFLGNFIMTLKIDLNTGPNHHYCDLEAEKLVYKLLTLVLYHRILF